MSIELIMNLFSKVCKYAAIGFLALLFGIVFSIILATIIGLTFHAFQLSGHILTLTMSPSIIIYLLPIGIIIAVGFFKLINE